MVSEEAVNAAVKYETRRAAAAYAIQDASVTRNAWGMADAALAAADAVMFSPENLSRAAQTLPLSMSQVLDVVAALRADEVRGQG